MLSKSMTPLTVFSRSFCFAEELGHPRLLRPIDDNVFSSSQFRCVSKFLAVILRSELRSATVLVSWFADNLEKSWRGGQLIFAVVGSLTLLLPLLESSEAFLLTFADLFNQLKRMNAHQTNCKGNKYRRKSGFRNAK